MLWTPSALNRLILLYKHCWSKVHHFKILYLQQRPLLVHLAAMIVVGLVDHMNTNIHCLLLYIDVQYVTNMQTWFHTSHKNIFFISNKQKYIISTHAVESMYSNIKNKQTNTYMYILKNQAQSHKVKSFQQNMDYLC